MKQLIIFMKKKISAGKEQILRFTTLPRNWPLWSEILCEILSYKNASNAAPCSDRLYAFRGHSYKVSSNWMPSFFPYIIV